MPDLARIHRGDAFSIRGSRVMVIGLLLLMLWSWPREAWAYIDPNAGGLFAQLFAPLIAIFLSFLFYCRREIRKILKLVRDRWNGLYARSDRAKAEEPEHKGSS